MRLRWTLLSLFAALLVTTPGVGDESSEINLVVDGVSDYRIVLPADSSPELSAHATLLHTTIRRISGAVIPVVTTPNPAGHNIRFILDEHDTIGYGVDGFRILTTDKSVRFYAHTERGIRNAVYTFLESCLGCRKWSETDEFIPQRKTITLPFIDDTQIPRFHFRMQDFKDPGYNAWHKLSSLEEWGLFVHTFDDLVPPERYFDDHPEYFSENLGVRTPEGQLCLSNPDVFRIVVDELRHRMEENPDAHYWSVSQNDTYLPCTCDDCRAIDDEEGSHSGSIIRFVNRVAAEFPDKTISTLAYQYSRHAPAITRPVQNVNIMLCSIECDRSRPIAADTSAGSFARDVLDWSELTDNIFLWDYVIQFRNLMSPFPNLHILQPNLQFFAEHGITAVFEQGLRNMQGEFAELRAYMLAKLLWDPYVDADSVMTDFLTGYYGNDAPQIRRYIETMHAALDQSGEGLSSFGYPFPSEHGYLSAAMIDSYRVIFDDAEATVAGQPVFRERVWQARLPLQYARLEQAKLLADGPRGCFDLDDHGLRRVKPEFDALLDTFTVRCERYHVIRLWEHGIAPSEYHDTTRSFFDGSTTPHLALECPVQLATPASAKYHDGEAHALTDGLVAWNDYNMHWLGFEGEDMDATIDLGHAQPVDRIETAFLQDQMAWIFLPVTVTVSVSEDGNTWVPIATVPAQLAPDHDGAVRVPFRVTLSAGPVRFIRVHAVNQKQCPPWHKGAGGPAWVFCDEIRVY